MEFFENGLVFPDSGTDERDIQVENLLYQSIQDNDRIDYRKKAFECMKERVFQNKYRKRG